MPHALVAAALSAAVASAPAGTVADRRVPVLVELFTSEGCSSCPPADEALEQLVETQPVPGARILALGEHVDYWDGLGWKDPYASSRYSARQERYARRLGLEGVYTPQLVVGGEAQVVGSDAPGARAAIAEAARTAKGEVKLRLDGEGGKEPVLSVEATWPAVPAQVFVALAEDRATSRVERGENAGRTLRHVDVARSLELVGEGAGRFAAHVPLDRSALRGPAHALVFVQERGGGRVLAVGAIAL